MTTISVDRTRRAALKRLLKSGRHFILVNENGDITDFDTYISFDPEAPGGTWHDISNTGQNKDFLSADEITASNEGITIRTGETTQTLDTHTYKSTEEPFSAKLGDARMVIRSEDGHNRVALNLAAATADDDMTLPTLCCARLRGNSRTATVAATDRYIATYATLATDAADVDANLPRHLLQELGRRKEWVMTVTAPATTITFHDIGITVTSANYDGEYPTIERLFPAERPGSSTVTVNPKRLTDEIKALEVPTPYPAMLTPDGTVFAADIPESPVEGASGTTGTDAAPVIGFDSRLLLRQTRAVGAKWDTVSLSWREARKPVLVDWGHGISGLIMPVRCPAERPTQRTTGVTVPA